MPKPRIALLVNFIAPSRVGLYERLAASLDLTILHGDVEQNRYSWEKLKINGASDKRIIGWQFSLKKKERGEFFDYWFLHFEPGYIAELISKRPDAVITDEMGFRTLVGLAYGSCFRKPVWVWWGGTPHTERHVGMFRKLLRGIIARWATRWISYGRTSTEYLLTLGIPRERILQVQNCVDETFYGAPAERELDLQPKPVLLHVGQMIARKGITEFLHAASRLQREGLKFSVVLVGGGRDLVKLQRLATKLCLENTSFYPAQPPMAMPAFYRSADALIFPTMRDVWGLVANEAILSGVPVLCSRYAGCAPELFDPECIFDPADENQFVEALRMAVTGQLPGVDKSRLWSSAKVGDAIANAVLESLVGERPKEPNVKADAISEFAGKN
ncbi:MAG TPA: glycosyltransferase family 4 protein [Candidatus Acidoferrales bacterium]